MDIRQKELQQLTKELLTISFANSMAYTRAVEAEDRIERLERIERALSQVQQKESMAYESLCAAPRMLK